VSRTFYLPQAPASWDTEYQRRLNAEIERAFLRFNPYAQLPAGGTTGYVLAKASDRDYDFEWIAAGTGGGGYPPQLGYAGI
jgi:hypothetical protein